MANLRKIIKSLWLSGRKDVDDQSLEELVNTAVDLLEAGDAKQAKALSLTAIKINPDCAEAWSNLSFAEIQLQNLESAEQAARRAVSINPYLANAWHNLGEAYVRMGQAGRSLECNNRALSIIPGRAVFWLGKGTALAAMERFTEAVACFDKALSIDPGLRSARTNREMALLHSQPDRWELLMIAVGIAAQVEDGRINSTDLSAKVMACFRSHPAFDEELVRSFDYFAQANIQMGKSLIIYFCQINLILAASLGDPVLIQVCRDRLAEARAKLG